MSVKALYQSQQDVGRNIKSSKKNTLGSLALMIKIIQLNCLFQGYLEKRRQYIMGKLQGKNHRNIIVFIIYSSVLGNFNYSMTIQSSLLTISNNGDLYDLRINNMQFSHLYHNEKQKKNFNLRMDIMKEIIKKIIILNYQSLLIKTNHYTKKKIKDMILVQQMISKGWLLRKDWENKMSSIRIQIINKN